MEFFFRELSRDTPGRWIGWHLNGIERYKYYRMTGERQKKKIWKSGWRWIVPYSLRALAILALSRLTIGRAKAKETSAMVALSRDLNFSLIGDLKVVFVIGETCVRSHFDVETEDRQTDRFISISGLDGPSRLLYSYFLVSLRLYHFG